MQYNLFAIIDTIALKQILFFSFASLEQDEFIVDYLIGDRIQPDRGRED